MSSAEAIAEWTLALGTSRVSPGGDCLCTFRSPTRYDVMLHPGSHEEVVECLRIANRHSVPVYPSSAGRNWGYGSQAPVRAGGALLSLARLDRIADFDEDLACVTLEPGVTFRQLGRFLAARGSALQAPTTGASPDASIIGNLMERGIGKGLYEDMSAHAAAFRVALPTGDTLETGSPLRRAPAGPALQGLFQQSNLGVVTRVAFWLERPPLLRQRAVLLLPDPAAVIDALRPILQRTATAPQLEFLNVYRYLGQTRQFPFDQCDSRAVLPEAWALDASGGHRWFASVMIRADSEAQLEVQRQSLGAVLDPFAPTWQPVEPGLESAESVAGLQSAYWRKRTPMPADPHPDRDGCGVLWIAPVLPMQGARAAAMLLEAERIVIVHAFEPAISLRPVGGRSMHALIGLFWDREEPGADDRAVLCRKALWRWMEREEIHPYRLGILDMDSHPTNHLLHSFKQLLDPNGILAPGRYLS